MIRVQQYVDRLGRNVFERWFSKLDESASLRVVRSLSRLEEGNTSTMKGIGSGLFEIRLDFGPRYRIYCGKDGETLVILLGGGTKARQQNDIEAARSLWQEYKAVKNGSGRRT